ncbi:MAG TPA: DUF2889 domain-containing protein [Ramlibacter sp.]|nr:DUF2889 domain-containing protein [Ramlibacter sp.]
MPLSPSVEREELHHRSVSLKVYRRKDGLYDAEAHLVDTKPFPFQRFDHPAPIPAGQPAHDFWLRLVVDEQYTIQAIEVAPDTTAFHHCPGAVAPLSALVGARIGKGWSKILRERLAREDNCTHLVELMQPLASALLIGMRGARPYAIRFPEGGGPTQIDTCHAWSAERELIVRYWPEHQRKAGAKPSP